MIALVLDRITSNDNCVQILFFLIKNSHLKMYLLAKNYQIKTFFKQNKVSLWT